MYRNIPDLGAWNIAKNVAHFKINRLTLLSSEQQAFTIIVRTLRVRYEGRVTMSAIRAVFSCNRRRLVLLYDFGSNFHCTRMRIYSSAGSPTVYAVSSRSPSRHAFSVSIHPRTDKSFSSSCRISPSRTHTHTLSLCLCLSIVLHLDIPPSSSDRTTRSHKLLKSINVILATNIRAKE